MILREALEKDISDIANLHALSWQENYKDVLSKNYLEYKVFDERLGVWTKRLNEPAENQYVLLAEDNGVLCGFICAYGNKHDDYGTIIDNLHVHADFKGKGIGKTLLAAAASWADNHYKNLGLYLEVLDCNVKAIGFYESLGAKKLASGYWQTPCGNKVKEYIYHWPTVPEIANKCLTS